MQLPLVGLITGSLACISTRAIKKPLSTQGEQEDGLPQGGTSSMLWSFQRSAFFGFCQSGLLLGAALVKFLAGGGAAGLPAELLSAG